MIHHSVSRWCFASTPIDQLCHRCQQLGISGIDLLTLEEIPEVQQLGLACSITAAHPDQDGIGTIEKGFNQPAYHPALRRIYQQLIPAAAELGVKQVICFSGNRDGLGDEEGLANCAKGLAPMVELAAQHQVTLVMELLNSKVDHPDYQCDRTSWGASLCERLNSPSFKLLYDIYHMQIMEGDIIRTIRENHQHIAHYHTAGVPGRHEFDATQELNYPAITRAIADTGFHGFIGQEYVPSTDDPFTFLAKAIQYCSPE
ncbi:TIM barrel protein [Verrucomicrobiaceae bacterium N1E253]|uniref:TIM barrel protein n=1 Tax=Oceaniferula marina TaxID=2748318 RepID=A0A851GLP4_9BACT|nr:TIM barrel protein [Oceaniferula marina]NWK56751.1 TIM barrel protein [Oceaniferula marina]